MLVEPRSINVVEIAVISMPLLHFESELFRNRPCGVWIGVIDRTGRPRRRKGLVAPGRDEASDFEVGGEGRQRRCGEEG